MKYLRVFLTSNRVLVCDSKPLNEDTQTSKTVEYYGEIPQCDYLTFANLREETKRELVYELNEEGEVVGVETERKYLTCDLIPNFYPPKTEEQLAKEKQTEYERLCEKYIREKYSSNDEDKVKRECLDEMLKNIKNNTTNSEKTTQFNNYNAYVESCKARAKVEVYK